jgi:replicative DNA helicase
MEQFGVARIPPNHPESERSVLGAMLRSGEAALLAIESLAASDFYDPANREIFQAMVAISASNRPIDIVTLDDQLSKKGRLDAVGGTGYLIELSTGVPSAANASAYIKIVDERSTLRKLIQAAESILGQCYAAQLETGEILEMAEKLIYDITMRKNGGELQPIQPILISTFEKIERIFKNHGKLEGVPTGYAELTTF